MLIDNVIDSIISPETTHQAIQQEILHATAVLGYSGGNSWPTYNPYRTARPDLANKGWVIPVTLSCTAWGHCYDIEAGGGKNENIGLFLHNAKNVWKTQDIWGLQWLYTFASNTGAMVAWARRFGYIQGRDYYVLAAHPNSRFGKHVCSPGVCGYPNADGTQHLFAKSFDSSILNSYMLPNATPKPIDVYALFPTFVGDAHFPNHGNERLTVEQCDGALHHPAMYNNYLKGTVRTNIKLYRDRCYRIAKYLPPHFTEPNPNPAWMDKRELGLRWQALNQRIKKIDQETK